MVALRIAARFTAARLVHGVMQYSENVDYLIASIIYLGTHSYYWGRTADELAEELGLDAEKLLAVFRGFPGLFRRTDRKAKNGQNYYALQARHAQREGRETKDPDGNEDIKPLDKDKLDLLIRFVLQMTEQEKTDRRSRWTNWIAVGASLVSALAALYVGLWK